MNLTRLLVAAAVLGGGLGMAAPANAADPNALGTYTFEAEDGESATWTVTPCADPDDDHCVFVQSSGTSNHAPWAANAYWTVGSWILFVNQPDAISCGDGGSAAGVNNYSWDATELTGYASINTLEGDCGAGPESVAIPFTLTKTGSGPVQYPDAPIYAEPDTAAPAPAEAEAEAPAQGDAMPAEQDPSIVATPEQIPNYSDPLTEAIVAEPGFNSGRR